MHAYRIELREIREGNKDACVRMRVTPDQAQYIASNEQSLETARENSAVARPFLICSDGEPVGFAMFAFDEEWDDPDDRYWLWRFMIDERLQGRGYGRAALEAIIAYFRDHGANTITLSTKENNVRALSLYHAFGFRETGEMNDEEIVLRLKLSF